jgi:hypothetical protein
MPCDSPKFRFMIMFGSCFTMGKAHGVWGHSQNAKGEDLGYWLVHRWCLILGMNLEKFSNANH